MTEKELQFLDQLEDYIETAFENEKGFLRRFWKGKPDDELLEVHMGYTCTRIAILLSVGQIVTDIISTKEFIEWCSIQEKEI